jgi:hypothetical protein
MNFQSSVVPYQPIADMQNVYSNEDSIWMKAIWWHTLPDFYELCHN